MFSVGFGVRSGVSFGLIEAVDQGVQRLQERFDQRRLVAIRSARRGMRQSGRRRRHLRERVDDVQIEVARNFFHDLGGHGILLIRK